VRRHLHTPDLLSREPTIPLPTLLHDAVELLKTPLNVIVAEERALDGPEDLTGKTMVQIGLYTHPPWWLFVSALTLFLIRHYLVLNLPTSQMVLPDGAPIDVAPVRFVNEGMASSRSDGVLVTPSARSQLQPFLSSMPLFTLLPRETV
jgi:hypothetical protein